jgi:hypothetical protein
MWFIGCDVSTDDISDGIGSIQEVGLGLVIRYPIDGYGILAGLWSNGATRTMFDIFFSSHPSLTFSLW